MLIQYLTKKFKDAANKHDSNTVVEANDQSIPVDRLPATGLKSHDPEGAAKHISQIASDHHESKAFNMQSDRKKNKEMTDQLRFYHA